MSRRLPSEAFDYYASLGPARSYQAVADHYGVTKRAVTKCASRDSWQQRLSKIEDQVRERSDTKLVDAIEEMNERHLRTSKILQAKALEALRALPITSAMHAVKALDLALRHERLVRGEPTDRTATQVEEVIRREYERWMVTDPDDESGSSELGIDHSGEAGFDGCSVE